LEEGIVAGAGRALDDIDVMALVGESPSKHRVIAAEILDAAIKVPMRQILENAGYCVEQVYGGGVTKGHGLDLKTGKVGDLFAMGVVDPMKVTRSALQNAVSVASTILSTNAIITMARSYESKS
jgi:chaperonin GroEL